MMICGLVLTMIMASKAMRLPESSDSMAGMPGRKLPKLNPVDPSELEYQVIRKLGSGCQGGVSKVFVTRDQIVRYGGRLVTIKAGGYALKKTSSKQMGTLEHEENLMAVCAHKNVGKFYCGWTCTEYSAVSHKVEKVRYLLLELAGDSLKSLINSGRYDDDIPSLLHVLIGGARGLEHLHNLGVAHNDLKLENICVTKDGTAKLIDFGMAQYVDRSIPEFDMMRTEWGKSVDVNDYKLDIMLPALRKALGINASWKKIFKILNKREHLASQLRELASWRETPTLREW